MRIQQKTLKNKEKTAKSRKIKFKISFDFKNTEIFGNHVLKIRIATAPKRIEKRIEKARKGHLKYLSKAIKKIAKSDKKHAKKEVKTRERIAGIMKKREIEVLSPYLELNIGLALQQESPAIKALGKAAKELFDFEQNVRKNPGHYSKSGPSSAAARRGRLLAKFNLAAEEAAKVDRGQDWVNMLRRNLADARINTNLPYQVQHVRTPSFAQHVTVAKTPEVKTKPIASPVPEPQSYRQR